MQISDDNMKFRILFKCAVTCIFILAGSVVAAQCELDEYPVEEEPKSDILVANFGDWLVSLQKIRLVAGLCQNLFSAITDIYEVVINYVVVHLLYSSHLITKVLLMVSRRLNLASG